MSDETERIRAVVIVMLVTSVTATAGFAVQMIMARHFYLECLRVEMATPVRCEALKP